MLPGAGFALNSRPPTLATCLRHARTGDPTDTSIKLRPLEPASGQALARDLVLKTRRRKGLGDQIAVSKYLDDEFIVRGCLFYTAGKVVLTVTSLQLALSASGHADLLG